MGATGTLAARHADGAVRSGDELVRHWLRQGKVWLLPLLLSDYGRDLIWRKYDAIATDRAYANQPRGRLGPLGAALDAILLRQDIHVGLRQRLDLVVEEVAMAVRDAWASGTAPVRLVSGPCGLARDLRLVWRELDAPEGRLDLLGLDLDSTGEVLPLAARLAVEAGVPLRTARCDLLDQEALRRSSAGQPADIVLSIGLTVWLDQPDLATFLAGWQHCLAPRGTLLIDNFRAHGASRFAADLEMRTRYHAPDVFERALADAGFAILARRETANHVNCLYRCWKVGG